MSLAPSTIAMYKSRVRELVRLLRRLEPNEREKHPALLELQRLIMRLKEEGVEVTRTILLDQRTREAKMLETNQELDPTEAKELVAQSDAALKEMEKFLEEGKTTEEPAA